MRVVASAQHLAALTGTLKINRFSKATINGQTTPLLATASESNTTGELLRELDQHHVKHVLHTNNNSLSYSGHILSHVNTQNEFDTLARIFAKLSVCAIAYILSVL